MKNLMIFVVCSFILSSCSKKSTDDVTPSGTSSTANAAAKYKTSFTVSGAQYGSLTYNFAKDGSQIERYDGVIEKDNYGGELTHLWIVDVPSSAKTIEDYVSLVAYTEKSGKGTFDIDYYGKGLTNTLITLRLGKDTDFDAWTCYKGKITVTDINQIGEPIAGTFEGDFFQASTTKTISVKNGTFSIERKASF
jgi:hypothetical protein